MKYGHIFVEGYTEVEFVKQVLKPHLLNWNLSIRPILIETSPGHGGGYTSYSEWNNQIKKSLSDKSIHLITTFIDLYEIPPDFPKPDHALPAIDRVQNIEQQWAADFSKSSRFMPYIALYEFEAMLFSDREILREHLVELAIDQKSFDKKLLKYKQIAPEDINDRIPPSKVIEAMIGNDQKYQKRQSGFQIAQAIGIDRIRAKCPHFDSWLTRLEKIGS
jgi:hypothetical protein